MNYKHQIKDLASRAVSKELAFAESEYRLRIEKLRSVMDKRRLDVLLITHAPNLSYLSGYQSFGTGWYSCMILPLEGEPTLHMHGLEFGPAMLTSWVGDIRFVPWSHEDATVAGLVDILKERGLEGKRIGWETKKPGLSIEIYEGLKTALPDATLVEASNAVAETRVVKSPAELECLRNSAKITLKAFDAVLPVIKAGITDNQIAAVIYETLIREGSEYFSTQPIVSAGQRNCYGHTTFRRTPIQNGDTVALEFGAAYQRYTSAIFHTIAIGKPSPLVEKRAKAVNETLDLMLQAVKPGRTIHDVAREAGAAGLEEVTGWPKSSQVYGYSIGLGFPPTWSENLFFLREGIEMELVPGMTFHSPLTVRIPGTPGVGFSETWVVTEAGCEILTKHERELTVVGA